MVEIENQIKRPLGGDIKVLEVATETFSLRGHKASKRPIVIGSDLQGCLLHLYWLKWLQTSFTERVNVESVQIVNSFGQVETE